MSDAEIQARDTAAAAKRRQTKTFVYGDVPPKYSALTFSGYMTLTKPDPAKKELRRLLNEYAERCKVKTEEGERNGLFLWGNSDQGKTGALSPVFLQMVNSLSMSGLWLQYNEMLQQLKDFSEPEEVSRRLKACKDVDILFVDDLGDPLNTKSVSDYDRDMIFQILDHRNTHGLPTLITSNLAPDQLALLFHERVMKRIREMCAIVHVTGKPMRDLVKEAKV